MAKSQPTVSVKIYEKTYYLPALSESDFSTIQQRIESRQQFIKEGKHEQNERFKLFQRKPRASFEERFNELKELVSEYKALLDTLATNQDIYLKFFAELTKELQEVVTKKCQELAFYEKERQQLEQEWEHDEVLSAMYASQKQQIFKSVFLLGLASILMARKIQLISNAIKKLTEYKNTQRQVLDEINKRLIAYKKTYELQKRINRVESDVAKLTDVALNFEKYMNQYFGSFQGLVERFTKIDTELKSSVTEIQGLVNKLLHESGIPQADPADMSEIVNVLVKSNDKQERLKEILSDVNLKESAAKFRELEIPTDCLEKESLSNAITSIETNFTHQLVKEIGEELNITSIDNSNEVRTQVSRNANTPVETIKQLARDPNWQVREGVASNSNTPVEVLEELAKDSNWEVRQAVALNPKTSLVALELLGGDPNRNVRQKVAVHPNILGDILEKLAQDQDQEVRREVAKNPNWPAETLKQLAHSADAEVRRRVALNPKASLELLQNLAQDEDQEVRREVAKNPNWSTEDLKQLAQSHDMWIREGVACNSKTSMETLEQLANDNDFWIRQGVASNKNTPVETLKQLARNQSWKVRRAVVSNPSTPIELLRELSQNQSWNVRREVALNPRTPGEVLSELSKDREVLVCEGVIVNPNTPIHTLQQLTLDKDTIIRQKANRVLKERGMA